jgi:hypothetical protein
VGNPALSRPVSDAFVERRTGLETLRTAAQDDGISRLDTKPGRVGGHVRAALEDHADNAQGHRHALDAQAVGALPARQNPTERVRQFNDGLQAGRDTFDASRIERQSVKHGSAEILVDVRVADRYGSRRVWLVRRRESPPRRRAMPRRAAPTPARARAGKAPFAARPSSVIMVAIDSSLTASLLRLACIFKCPCRLVPGRCDES